MAPKTYRIVLGNGKGGVGKSTLSILLALCLSRRNKALNIGVEDLNSIQASASNWLARLAGDAQVRVRPCRYELKSKTAFFDDGTVADICFTDTPAAGIITDHRNSLYPADLYLVPTGLTQLEVEESLRTVQCIRHARGAKVPLRVIVNRMKGGSDDAARASALAEHLPLAESRISDRKAFSVAQTEGYRAVTKNSEASAELNALAREVAQITGVAV